MQQPDHEDIWLTNLKFTRQWQEEEVEDAPQGKGGAEKYSGAALLQGQAGASKNFTRPETSKSNPYDRLAADRPGQELTPDSTIWKLYVNEAKEYDEELVLAKNRNLDMMLVFAALFSAILTSFLLDSKNMMQPDSGDTSNQLLMRIAERLENPNAPSTSVELPAFSPSSSARWINGLWFTSLVFSLSAALIAMLAKEWLDTFVTSRPRPAHDFARIRQARLHALSSWGALHIIDYLPLFLHISLLMFSLGLVVYLYTAVDATVATIVALTTGATAFFYVITNLLSVLYEVSPFGTQISHSTRKILIFVANHWTYAERWKPYFAIKQTKSEDGTTAEQDLQALRWLSNHAQDPLVGDSAYHALAGFRSSSSPSDPPPVPQDNAAVTPGRKEKDTQAPLIGDITLPALSGSRPSPSPSDPPKANPPAPAPANKAVVTPGQKEKLVTTMFVDVCQRLGEARSAGAHELEVSCGASVARYAATLPHLVNYLQPHPHRELLIKFANDRRRYLGAEAEKFDPPKQALNALDSILDNTCPPFTADAYAWITASELRLVTDIAGSLKSTRNSTRNSQLLLGSGFTRRDRCLNSTAAEHVISMLHGVDFMHNSDINIFELQARYSRSLARASFQLFFHSNNRAPMGAFSLISLLESLKKAAECKDLNQIPRNSPYSPERRLSTHHPQNPNEPTKLPDFNIFLVGAGDSYELRSGEIGDPCGLLAGVLNILGVSGARNVPGVEFAAANALNSIAPMFIKQLLGHDTKFTDLVESQGPSELLISTNGGRGRSSSHVLDRISTTPGDDLGNPPNSPTTPRSPLSAAAAYLQDSADDGWPIYNPILSITHWALGQMLVLAAFAKSRQGQPGIGELPRLSLRGLNHRFQSCFPRSTAFTIAQAHTRELKYLVDNFDQVDVGVTDKDSANTHLLQVLALKEDRTVYSTYLEEILGRPSRLLGIMQNAFAPPATIETLLLDISNSALNHWPYFTDLQSDEADQGLSQLLKLGERHEYAPGVARCIFRITQTAAAAAREGPVFTTRAVGVFFEAMRFVLNHHASDPKKPLDLYAFVGNMFTVVRAFDSKDDELIKKHIPRKEVKVFLRTISKNTALKTRVQEDLEKRFKKSGDDEHQDEPSKPQVVPGGLHVPEAHQE